MADYSETWDALDTALRPLGLEWAVEGLMYRLRDVDAFDDGEEDIND